MVLGDLSHKTETSTHRASCKTLLTQLYIGMSALGRAFAVDFETRLCFGRVVVLCTLTLRQSCLCSETCFFVVVFYCETRLCFERLVFSLTLRHLCPCLEAFLLLTVGNVYVLEELLYVFT